MCPKNGGQYTIFLGTPISIYRISNVYLTYIYRISTVVYSGEIGSYLNFVQKRELNYK